MRIRGTGLVLCASSCQSGFHAESCECYCIHAVDLKTRCPEFFGKGNE